ncbi:deoxynucleoside kinase isoform X2 [Leptinotarsa decemlineata]|nr:deoxynucleoside kinase-like isoform X2 [Leptinotarsa decemlineata]XP_023023110.1 deoxynucleoside kinase-like isoform X2 [Leptinotarsa decemlineata]XP_023023111.1 deoxynucleoside kinase-like isoform X2 [Leptinotarsa decemlineata]
MEGVITTSSGMERSDVSIEVSPSKKSNFVGISPLRELTNVKTPSDRPFRVSIEGNIGAGKSTLIQYFQNMPEIDTYPEPLEWWRNLDGHNLLDLMYSNNKEWLRVFQSYVQFTRLKLQTSKPSSTSTTVQMFERSIQNNRFCFLELAYRSGYLHGADYSVLDQWYRWIRANEDISLDLIVYLRSSPEVVYERVKERGRPEETGVSLQYLTELHESHERWLMTDDEKLNTTPVLVLDADRTREEIMEQYRKNEEKILGYDKLQRKKVSEDDKIKVKKTLAF